MIITEEQVKRIMPQAGSSRIAEFVRSFNQYSEAFGISTKLRAAGYLAQVAVESVQLSATVENLNYSAAGLRRTFPKYFPTDEIAASYARRPEKIANRVYANRMGNGDEKSGDGWRYRGRGYIQLTGKNNYRYYATSRFCVGDLMGHPEWIAQQPGCQKASMFFWFNNGLNELADKRDIVAMSKRVNGGTNGLAERQRFYRTALQVLEV